MSTNVSLILLCRIVVDTFFMFIKVLIAQICFVIIFPSPALLDNWDVWVWLPFQAFQITVVSYIVCIILKEYSMIILFCCFNFVFSVLINGIIRPNDFAFGLVVSLILPGFFYTQQLRYASFYRPYPKYEIIYGFILSLAELAITMVIFFVLANKNKKKVAKKTDALEPHQILSARNI